MEAGNYIGMEECRSLGLEKWRRGEEGYTAQEERRDTVKEWEVEKRLTLFCSFFAFVLSCCERSSSRARSLE